MLKMPLIERTPAGQDSRETLVYRWKQTRLASRALLQTAGQTPRFPHLSLATFPGNAARGTPLEIARH